MAGSEAIIVAHYQAAREEIRDRLRRRDQFVILFVSGVSVLTAFVVANGVFWPVIGLIPFAGAVAGTMYANNDIAIGRIGSWLKNEYGRMLQEYETHAGTKIGFNHWDASSALHDFLASESFFLRYYAAGLVFFIPSVLATILFFLKGASTMPGLTFILLMLLMLALALASVIVPLSVGYTRRRIHGYAPKLAVG